MSGTGMNEGVGALAWSLSSNYGSYIVMLRRRHGPKEEAYVNGNESEDDHRGDSIRHALLPRVAAVAAIAVTGIIYWWKSHTTAAAAAAAAGAAHIGSLRVQEDHRANSTETKNRFKVAVAVLFTTGPKINYTLSPGAVDSAAVLLRSVEKFRGRHYGIEYLALVTPEVDKKWMQVIEAVGYKAREVKVPIETSDIRNARLAREIDRDGRLGINEMVKIEPFLFTEYDRVLMVDSDIMFHRNFDELIKTDVDQRIALQWTHGYTEEEHMNGGFLIINPKCVDSVKHRDAILDILREGDHRSNAKGHLQLGVQAIHSVKVRESLGWKGTGYGTLFGGRTIQGLLPYYFLHVLNGTASMPIDRCKYNNMQQTRKCQEYPFEEITSNHFTGSCKKPWKCFGAITTYDRTILAETELTKSPICAKLQEAWWQEWSQLAEELGAPSKRCDKFVSQYLYNAL